MRKAATAQEETREEKTSPEEKIAHAGREKVARAKQFWESHPGPRVALGVGAAAGGGLLAALTLGVGPAAIAGAAGYLAYRGLKQREMGETRSAGTASQLRP